ATDKEIRSDAEVLINGQPYYLELDRGTMSYAQIGRRFRVYEGCPHLSLWVCSSAERRDGMRQRAGILRSTALFTTLAEAIASPPGRSGSITRGRGRPCRGRVGENRGNNPGEILPTKGGLSVPPDAGARLFREIGASARTRRCDRHPAGGPTRDLRVCGTLWG